MARRGISANEVMNDAGEKKAKRNQIRIQRKSFGFLPSWNESKRL